MFNNPYLQNNYNTQNSIDRINTQINELEKMRNQLQQTPIQQPTNLTQNFQLAPTNNDVIRYANSIEDVARFVVIGDTPYFSKDMSVVWIKNTKGEIKTYELNEIIPKDEKDIQIELLQAQIDELKEGMNNNEQHSTNDIKPENEPNTKEYNEPVRNATKESKSTSIQRISTGKKK